MNYKQLECNTIALSDEARNTHVRLSCNPRVQAWNQLETQQSLVIIIIIIIIIIFYLNKQ